MVFGRMTSFSRTFFCVITLLLLSVRGLDESEPNKQVRRRRRASTGCGCGDQIHSLTFAGTSDTEAAA